MVVFFAPQVRDVATGQIVAGLVGQSVTIVYPGTSDPVEISEYDGGVGPTVPGSVLTVGPQFSLTSFSTPDEVYVVEALASNGTRVRLTSDEGMRIEAELSRAAAEAAAVAAADAASTSAAALSDVQSAVDAFQGDLEDMRTEIQQFIDEYQNGGGTGGGSGVLVLTNDDPDPEWTGAPVPFFRYEPPASNLMAELAWLVTGTTGGTTTSTNVTANPADQVGGSAPAAGDIMVAILQNDTNVTADPVAPAGWTRFIPSGLPGITGTMGSRVYWKVRGSGDSSYTWTMPEAKHARVSIVGFRGAEAFASWTVGAAKVRYEGTPESTTSTAPSVTSSRSTALAVAFVMERTANDETDISSFTPGWEKRAFFAQTGSVLGTLGVFAKAFVGAGSTGDFVATYPNSQSNNGAGFQLLIGAGS